MPSWVKSLSIVAIWEMVMVVEMKVERGREVVNRWCGEGGEAFSVNYKPMASNRRPTPSDRPQPQYRL